MKSIAQHTKNGSLSPDGGHFENVPLDGHVELAQVHANIDDVGALHFVDVPQVDLFFAPAPPPFRSVRAASEKFD